MSNQSSTLPTLSVDLIRAAKLSEGILSKLDEKSLQELETQYRKFFFLNGKYPNQTLAPTRIIDEMWHLHILHPKAYVEDCMSNLGYILDHDPGFGKEPGTMPVLQENFDTTGKLWETEFGEAYTKPIIPDSVMEMSSDPTQCRSIKEGEVEPQPDREQGEPEISPDSLPGERESPEEEEETK